MEALDNILHNLMRSLKAFLQPTYKDLPDFTLIEFHAIHPYHKIYDYIWKRPNQSFLILMYPFYKFYGGIINQRKFKPYLY